MFTIRGTLHAKVISLNGCYVRPQVYFDSVFLWLTNLLTAVNWLVGWGNVLRQMEIA